MSSAFGLTFSRNDAIKAVLRVLGVIGQTQVPSPEDYTFCSEALNLMLKAWVNKGATLWKIDDVEVPVVEGAAVYGIGPAGGSVVSVTVTDGGSGYTSASVDFLSSDGTGAAATATIVDGVITAVTVTDGGGGYEVGDGADITGDGTGATVTVSVAGIRRSLIKRVLDEGNFIRNNTTTYDQPIFQLSRNDYNRLGNKLTNGTIPSQFWFDPRIDQGNLYVYPVPGPEIDHTMHLMGQIIIDDTAAAADVFDFPQEFLNAIKWGLAYDLIPEYGVDDRTEARIKERYAIYVKEAFDFSVEEASTYFTYDSRAR